MSLSKDTSIILILIFVLLSNLYDMHIDAAQGVTNWHLIEEIIVMAVTLAAILWLVFHWLKQRKELVQLKAEINQGIQFAEQPSAETLEARQLIGKFIQEQFTTWDLTASEKDVALFILKGLSFKEIAAIRNTLEKTVRQQASSIYKKAGVSGRHAFSAWFIEDYL